MFCLFFFFFKQKTAYEMRISDWSSDVCSSDLLENDPDVPALIGASAALTISGLPFLGPIGGARVAYIKGEYVLNPRLDEMSLSELDLVVAGTQEGVLMVESEASELTEEVMLGAVTFGHREYQKVIDAIISLAEILFGRAHV